MSARNKKNQSGWWNIWRLSGAVQGIQQQTPSVDPEKVEAMECCRTRLRAGKNLSESEIEELVQFEFIAGPDTVTAQLRRYYLKVKEGSPDAAEKMKRATQAFETNTLDIVAIELLCRALHRFISGFLIRCGGQSYTASSAEGFHKV